MAVLRELRVKVNEETIIELEAEAIASERDGDPETTRLAVAREILTEWARRRRHAATVSAELRRRKGFDRANGGESGHE